MKVVIFDNMADSFYPITHIRSVGDLRCGALKLRQRLEYIFPDTEDITRVIIEDRLESLYNERHPEWEVNHNPNGLKLYINSRVMINEDIIEAIKSLKLAECILYDGVIVAACTEVGWDDGLDLSHMTVINPDSISLYNNISDLVHDNGRMIRWDFEHVFYEADNYFETELGVTVLHPYNIWIGDNVTLSPNVVLDASEGPIIIDSGTKVMANSVLTGPLYIGKDSLVKIGAKIYGNVSIGPVCKIGGEVEGSIFQAYSNKQHDGFLGHAFIGEWVNLGADTNNSDLKNTYKDVHMYNYVSKNKINTRYQFMGCAIGDHSKTGINTSLNTGVVIGTACNIYGTGLFDGYIPDFSWGMTDTLTRYRFQSMCDTAKLVKQRRNLEFTQTEQNVLEDIYGE